MARFNRDDIDKFHDYGLYVPSRTIYMGSEEVTLEDGESGTDGRMAEKLIKNLTILERMNSEPITIIMNNLGGEVYHGLAIFDAIRACKSHVKIVAMGHAMSMGSIILQAADERIMAPNAKQMIHYGYSEVSGHSKTVKKWSDENERLNNWMETMYLEKMQQKNPKITLSSVKKMLNHDTFLDAEQSIGYGLCDKVLGDNG